jgi:hypothetical protein
LRRRRALRRLQRVRLPNLPGLLRVRAPGGHAELPAVQDAPQGQVTPSDPAAACLSLTRGCFPAGCARVPGVDDLENEFNWEDSRYVAESMLRAHMSYGRAAAALPERPPPHQRPDGTRHSLPPALLGSVAPPHSSLISASVQVDDIPPEQHALVPSFMGGGGGGKRIHPLPYADPNLPGASPPLLYHQQV